MPLVANRLRPNPKKIFTRRLSGGETAGRALLLAAAVLAFPDPGFAWQPTSLLPPQVEEAPPPPPSAGAPKSLLPGVTPEPAPPLADRPQDPAETRPPAPAAPPPMIADQADVFVRPTLPPPVTETIVPTDPLAGLAGPTGSVAQAGLLDDGSGGYGTDLFNGSDGRFLAALLRGVDAPLASRWAQILLQRALLTIAAPPPGINPGDWVAARGMALVAMGSASDAHRMIQRIAIDQYTQNLYSAAGQAALASADPVALCPLSVTADALTQLPSWRLASGMCAALLNDEYESTLILERARGEGKVASFDIGLAERIASTIGGGRVGANPEWESIDRLTSWRVGLATAAGLEIPDTLVKDAGPAVRAWIARVPGVPPGRRILLAPEAAALGVLSSTEVNRVAAAAVESLDAQLAPDSPGGLLRRANAADSIADRLEALTDLWKRSPEDSLEAYGWRIATAIPAARLPVEDSAIVNSPDIAAALVSAGLTGQATRWWLAAASADIDVRARLWAMLAGVSDDVPIDAGFYERWAETVPEHRAQLVAAGLLGLGRSGLPVETESLDNAWTRALDRAVAEQRRGEVILLVATGLHGGWNNVHPDYLRRIVAALKAVGHEAEARLMVAEAAFRG